MDNSGAAACWSLCLPRPGDGDHGIELNEVSVKGSESDSTSDDPAPEPMSRANPTWHTRRLFDADAHLKLDATGLHPNHLTIGNSLHSEEEIARLLNHAKAIADSSPLICPQGFDADTHAQRQADGSWGPNLPAILGDNNLTDAQKVDVFRWARIYRPDTHTDPACVKKAMQMTGCLLVSIAAIATIGGMAALTNQLLSGSGCRYIPMNGTEAEALVQSLREEFPQLVNATLENAGDWLPTLNPHLPEPIYRDRNGNILETVCTSAAQTLDPVLSLMVVFSLMAIQMLLQG